MVTVLFPGIRNGGAGILAIWNSEEVERTVNLVRVGSSQGGGVGNREEVEKA